MKRKANDISEDSMHSISLLEMAATYSILAMDREAGEMGGAVQSHFFSVGPAVLWAEAGTGVVATQSLVNRQYGPDGLSQLRQRRHADQVLQSLLECDAGSAYRQAAVIDAMGNTAAHTGDSCIREAGHSRGECYSVQANMMLNNTVWHAMEDAFLSTPGSLADRLLGSLKAAEAEGGDIRGKQSAAMVVVKCRASGNISEDQVLDLRVEDHSDPLTELTRLLTLYRGYEMLERGDSAMEHGDADAAKVWFTKAREHLGGNPEALYWHGISLLQSDDADEGMELLSPLFSSSPNWLELTLRLPESGLAVFSPGVLTQLKKMHT